MATVFKGEFARVLGDLDGTLEVTFKTKDKRVLNELKANKGELQIEVDKWREKRSLNANNYFYALADKIAEATNTGRDEVKNILMCDYGTVHSIMRVPKGADLKSLHLYTQLIGESETSNKPCEDYYIFKPTHTMNTAEMSRLIEGTIQEAQQLGIETRTPDEIANMMSLWEKVKK